MQFLLLFFVPLACLLQSKREQSDDCEQKRRAHKSSARHASGALAAARVHALHSHGVVELTIGSGGLEGLCGLIGGAGSVTSNRHIDIGGRGALGTGAEEQRDTTGGDLHDVCDGLHQDRLLGLHSGQRVCNAQHNLRVDSRGALRKRVTQRLVVGSGGGAAASQRNVSVAVRGR